MDRPAIETAISALLPEMRRRLDNAAGIARAAQACAEAGNVEKAIEVALDIEQLAYEASRLLDAVSLLNRLSRPQ